MSNFLANTSSGFLLEIADEATTRSAFLMRFGSCPICTLEPNFFNSSTSGVITKSEPVILNPLFWSIVAKPIIPDPPMPII